MTLGDSTIVGNDVGDTGYGGGLNYYGGTAVVNNTIVAQNTKVYPLGPGVANDMAFYELSYDDPGGISSDSSNNLIGTGGSGSLTNGVNGNQVGVADPGLDPNGLQDNGGPTETIALEPGSPAIDAGSNALAVDANGNPLQYDQRGPGYPRIVNGIVDIGAFEFQGNSNPVPVLNSISPSLIGVSYASPITLTVDGSGFISQSVVDWNGTALATSDVSSTELTATIPASDFTSVGNASITVTNPAPGGGTSSALTFQVLAAPSTAFVNAAWAGDALGTSVTWSDGSTHYVGYDAFGTIQAGIDAVAVGGTVDVAAGNYTETDTIAQNVTINGAGASLVTVNGAGAGCVFTIDSGIAAELSGLTITGGYSVGFGQGGGVSNEGTATLDDCTISGNSGAFGGGFGQSNSDASAIITDCTISGNSAQDSGGGLWIQGEATLTGCTISGNSAGPSTPGARYGYGGGVYTNSGTFTFYGCTISGNSAADGGGGLDNLASIARMKLSDCTISNNRAPNEGGGLLNDGTATLSDCTISGNSAGSGGGLCNRYSTNLTACTISGNSAGTDGGGLMNGGYIVFYSGQKNYLWGMARIEASTISGNSAGSGGGLYMPKSSSATLTDTIVAGNTVSSGGASDIAGDAATVATGTYNLVGTGGSGGLTAAGNNLLDVADPLLSALGNYGGPTQTIALLPGSPAIGAGTAISGITTDQRGVTLPTSGIDIGAFQSQGFTLSIISGTPQSATVNTAFAGALVVRVTANDPVEPVAGGVVTFDAPSSGASAVLSSTTATIGSNGTVSITAAANGTVGSYTVTASAAGAASAADFELTNAPLNLTADLSVTYGGFVYNRTTRQFTQTLTIRNTTGAAIIGPIELVLLNLKNATLANETGTYEGNPYITILSSGSLGAGQSLTITLTFVDPTLAPITYTSEFLAGPLPDFD
jgi:parallel beta-helix repeat protein